MTNLHVTHHDHVATVTLARADMRNAFNDAVIAELTQTFIELGQCQDVRAIVLAAEGKAFCAGADLNWMRQMADYTREENIADAGKLADMLHVIYACPKPTVARIQGDVYAGGMGLVAACDIAVAVETAGFCLSEVKLGLIPATISPYVIRAMGARAAHRYFLTAERFSAQEALRIGFIHALVAEPETAQTESNQATTSDGSVSALDQKIAEITRALVQAGPQAVQSAKQLVMDIAEHAITPDLIAQTVEGIANIRASAEGKEGVQSFLQKRKPQWLS
ncbi:enoyl-CoA hydratase/isomerase family protein [Lampropedia puyangensis]|uniref:Enoyl-CoA hydratase/isomerase family protein n=1 Tax=Lampropedia puyangensis TaxID=1330072 RepID=A0A4S8EW35_9BURK|nr:enoyl-CoA hydratase/isomerase family protein [Lampropedia puyangensis]THT98736.1 enoyl-CoA hydratase/isomerase family protein [Lampropedia puyangensis]